MSVTINRVSRNSLIRKAVRIGYINANDLSSKILLKIVNSHNINKRLNCILSKKPYERAEFIKTDLEKTIELDGLSLKDLKELAKFRKIYNYGEISKDDRFCTLLRTEKSPQEDKCLKCVNFTSRSDIKERINHTRLMLTQLGNKLTSKERKEINKEMNDMEDVNYTRTMRERAIRRLVELTNILHNKQKQHTKHHHDQTYYGLKDIQHYYEPILVRWAFNKNFEQYEIRGDKNRNLSINEYLAIIYPQLKELTDKKKTSTKKEQKVQLKIAIVFRHITELSNRYIVYIKSNNIIMRSGDDTYDIMTKLYESFLENYEQEENTLRNGSNFIYDCVDLALIQFHKIKLKRGGMYIETPKWVSGKKATINPKRTNHNCCFAYSIVAAMHYEEIDRHPDRITKLAPFIDNYNWTDIYFPTEQKDYSTFERNNKHIALNILSAQNTKKKLNIIYRSDHNRKRKHQVILLMATDNHDNWHYIAVKNISRLCRGVTSNNNGDHYCLNCLHACRAKNALIRHEKICNDHSYCNPLMPKQGKNIFKHTHVNKSLPVAHQM